MIDSARTGIAVDYELTTEQAQALSEALDRAVQAHESTG